MFNLFSEPRLTLFFLVAIVIFLISIIITSNNFNNKKSDIILSIGIVIIYLMINFNREGVGTDEPNYLSFYLYYQINPENFYYGFSFEAIYFLFDFFGVSEKNFNFYFSSIYPLLAFWAVFFCVDKPYKAIILFAFLFSNFSADFTFNVYRHGLAACVLIISLQYFFKKQYVLFLIFAAIGYGLHWSIFIPYSFFIIGYFLSTINVFRLLCLGFILNFSAIFINFNLFEVFHSVISLVSNDNVLYKKISSYILYSTNSFYDNNIFGKLKFMIPVLFTYGYAIYNVEQLKKFNWFPLFTLLGLYSFLLLDMSYSFRNYYWFLIFFPFMLTHIHKTRSTNLKLSSLVYFSYVLVWAFLGFFSSSLMPMIYV